MSSWEEEAGLGAAAWLVVAAGAAGQRERQNRQVRIQPPALHHIYLKGVCCVPAVTGWLLTNTVLGAGVGPAAVGVGLL